jgi:hypothetical protein
MRSKRNIKLEMAKEFLDVNLKIQTQRGDNFAYRMFKYLDNLSPDVLCDWRRAHNQGSGGIAAHTSYFKRRGSSGASADKSEHASSMRKVVNNLQFVFEQLLVLQVHAEGKFSEGDRINAFFQCRDISWKYLRSYQILSWCFVWNSNQGYCGWGSMMDQCKHGGA